MFQKRYKNTLRGIAFLFLGLSATLTGLSARDFSSLQAEFWVDIEPFGSTAPGPALSADEAASAVLEEARAVFSGMIYGYDFSYVPGDEARQVAERFMLNASRKIAWGDNDFEVREVRRDQFSQFLRARYLPKSFEIALLESWVSSHIVSSGGTGYASYFKGSGDKLQALEDAVRDAIRNYARGISHNKPARIEGHAILVDPPQNVVASGQYRTRVVIRLMISAMDQYRTF